MEENQFFVDKESQIIQRTFQCHCGKVFKKSSSLYFHQKQKHNVVNSQQWVDANKPKVKPYKSTSSLKSQKSICLSNENKSERPSQKQEQRGIVQNIEIFRGEVYVNNIANKMNEINIQIINKMKINELPIVKEINKYLTGKQKQQQQQNTKIIHNLTQFLQRLATKIPWQKFEQAYILFAVFLQFISDEYNDPSFIAEAQSDTLCEFINDFIELGIQGLIKELQVQGLPVFQTEVTLFVIENFFQWLTCNEYITYKVKLNDKFNKVETKQSF